MLLQNPGRSAADPVHMPRCSVCTCYHLARHGLKAGQSCCPCYLLGPPMASATGSCSTGCQRSKGPQSPCSPAAHASTGHVSQRKEIPDAHLSMDSQKTCQDPVSGLVYCTYEAVPALRNKRQDMTVNIAYENGLTVCAPDRAISS